MLLSLSRFRPGLHSGNFISFRLLILYFFASFSVIFFATGFLSSIFSTLWFFIHRFSLPQASCLLSFPPRPSYPRFSLSLVYPRASPPQPSYPQFSLSLASYPRSYPPRPSYPRFSLSHWLLILDLLPRPSYPRFSLYLVSYLSSFSAATFLSAIFFVSGFLSSSFSAATFLSAIFFVSGFLSSIFSAATFLSAIFFVSGFLSSIFSAATFYPRFS